MEDLDIPMLFYITLPRSIPLLDHSFPFALLIYLLSSIPLIRKQWLNHFFAFLDTFSKSKRLNVSFSSMS